MGAVLAFFSPMYLFINISQKRYIFNGCLFLGVNKNLAKANNDKVYSPFCQCNILGKMLHWQKANI